MMPQVLRHPIPLTSGQVVMLFAVLTGVVLGVAPRFKQDVFTGGSSAVNPAHIETSIRSYAGDWQPARDPMVTLDNGMQVKSSNVNGVEIEGDRYYYRPIHGFSADPVSRGAVKDYQVVLVLEAGTEFETEVYRVPG